MSSCADQTGVGWAGREWWVQHVDGSGCDLMHITDYGAPGGGVVHLDGDACEGVGIYNGGGLISSAQMCLPQATGDASTASLN